jgi:hypothetical protein
MVYRIESVEISSEEHREAVCRIEQRMEQEEISFKDWLENQKKGRKA